MADIAKIKEVRERTGVGFADCRRALEQSDWSVDEAIDHIRRTSAIKAAKKASRDVSEGLVVTKISDDGKTGVIAEVNIETDFAARSDRFVEFSKSVVDALLDEDSGTADRLEEMRKQIVQVMGENVVISRSHRIVSENGQLTHYVHPPGSIGTLVETVDASPQVARQLAMHITAMNPLAISANDLAAGVIEKERAIFTQKALDQNKPENIVARIVDGQMKKFMEENCLLQQEFFMDSDKTVEDLLKPLGATCARFVRYKIGEIDEETQEAA